ncbi:MAG: hypothetical protein V6Z89_06405 [Desulfobacter sp.]
MTYRNKFPAALAALFLFVFLAGGATPGIARDGQGTAEDRFEVFARSWTQQIRGAYLYTRQSPRMEKTASGYVASYYDLDPASVRLDVKPAEGLPGVYTGVLYYDEHLVRSSGITRDKAAGGRFSTVSIRQMMEIFLYENGEWVK